MPSPIAVQVLGSGGPDTTDARASAGYLLWVDGEANLLDGSGGLVQLEIKEIPADAKSPQTALAEKAFTLKAVGVVHGRVPALGYLVETRGKKIAFSGDQNGDNPAFAAMIKGADVLIMDHAIPEDAGEVETFLHARPSEIGKLAAAAGVRKLVLSHNMQRSLVALQKGLDLIRVRYKGPTLVAKDLMCVEP